MSDDVKLEYYDLRKDIEDYPEAWCYVIYSHRGPGKTYSTLKMNLQDKRKFIYMKRTIDDVDILCADIDDNNMDLSPYKPINRDLGTNIHPFQIKKGLGAFYEEASDGTKVGDYKSIILAMSAIKKYKGFDMSECDQLVFDEFAPPIGERLNRKEGDLLMELYMTVSRDRIKRGKGPLKLILLSNTNDISTPITNTLEITDTMADMAAEGKALYYDTTRGMLFHHLIEPKFQVVPENDPVRQAMGHTAWGRMAFSGDFAYNDFSNVCKLSLKGMQPFIHLVYKTYDYYIYTRNYDGLFYMTFSKAKCPLNFNLNKENDQKRFYIEEQPLLRDACIDDRMKFLKYSMYDLIVNYKNFFQV